MSAARDKGGDRGAERTEGRRTERNPATCRLRLLHRGKAQDKGSVTVLLISEMSFIHLFGACLDQF